jgi:DNA (cytosine-5)-methyltransferase 1
MECRSTDWGDYGPAVARWEAILGRPAPPPADERGRLSPRFVEFMMGLPAGWVTDVPDVSRAQALRMLGNGVLPQQAAAAITALLSVREVAA